jgi:ketosteroid isomerase-like protein
MRINEAIRFCSDWLSSWSGNNPDGLIRFYSENAFYRDPANTEGLRGHIQILPYFKKLLASNANWKWEHVEVFPTGNGFVVKWKATIPVGRDVIVENGLDIVEIQRGKITRNEVYFDRTKWLEALRKTRS